MTATRPLTSTALALLFACCACGTPDDDVAPVARAPMTLGFALPVECDAPPLDLDAVAWVSGTRAPYELEVDVAAGTTRGTLELTTGAERRIVVDWFVVRGGTRVLLGQATKSIDLTAVQSDDPIMLTIAPEDVEVAVCRDVSGDVAHEGTPTTSFQGEERPACDLDESCGGSLAPECSNLGELCAGADPLS